MPLTLCVDIGGTNIKASVLGGEAERFETVPTPRPATPPSVLDAVAAVAQGLEYDRVSVGFPGVVHEGVTYSAPNLDEGWAGFDFARELGARLDRPVRVINDADLAGLGVIEGRGVEMVLTLGTGMGAAVFVDGKLVPNLELGHHPFGDGQTYEERVADATLAAIGRDAWRARVQETVRQIRPIWNFRRLYLGGGNARLLSQADFPGDVVIADNRAAVHGGARLWD